MNIWIVGKELMKHWQKKQKKKISQQLKHGKYYIDADNKHAKTVWRDFELKNLQSFTKYLKQIL